VSRWICSWPASDGELPKWRPSMLDAARLLALIRSRPDGLFLVGVHADAFPDFRLRCELAGRDYLALPTRTTWPTPRQRSKLPRTPVIEGRARGALPVRWGC
jgi:hypothetical protein